MAVKVPNWLFDSRLFMSKKRLPDFSYETDEIKISCPARLRTLGNLQIILRTLLLFQSGAFTPKKKGDFYYIHIKPPFNLKAFYSTANTLDEVRELGEIRVNEKPLLILHTHRKEEHTLYIPKEMFELNDDNSFLLDLKSMTISYLTMFLIYLFSRFVRVGEEKIISLNEILYWLYDRDIEEAYSDYFIHIFKHKFFRVIDKINKKFDAWQVTPTFSMEDLYKNKLIIPMSEFGLLIKRKKEDSSGKIHFLDTNNYEDYITFFDLAKNLNIKRTTLIYRIRKDKNLQKILEDNSTTKLNRVFFHKRCVDILRNLLSAKKEDVQVRTGNPQS